MRARKTADGGYVLTQADIARVDWLMAHGRLTFREAAEIVVKEAATAEKSN